MADMLQDQYSSVFSNPDSEDIVFKSHTQNRRSGIPQGSPFISTVLFSPADIEEAIDAIPTNSASDEHDIPVSVATDLVIFSNLPPLDSFCRELFMLSGEGFLFENNF